MSIQRAICSSAFFPQSRCPSRFHNVLSHSTPVKIESLWGFKCKLPKCKTTIERIFFTITELYLARCLANFNYH